MMNRILVLSATLCLTLTTSVFAQEKFGDKRIYTTTKAETLSVGDADGHVLVLSEAKGYDLQARNVIISHSVADLVKGNGRMFGYGTATEPDGDKSHYTFEGQVVTQAGPDGKPLTRAEGTWTLTGGTGKWQARQGGGVFKNAVVGPGMSFAEWEGIWEPK